MEFRYEDNLLGGEEDQQRLLVLFTHLGFDVRIHKNLTADQMIRKAESYSKMQHNGVFFLVILSHGTQIENKDAVLGTDSKSVTVHQLESLFHASGCPSLHNLPKIFMIDACRGDKEERVYTPNLNISGMIQKREKAGEKSCLISGAGGADSAHIAIIYASTYGKVAYATNKGSQMTQTFVDVTTEATPDKDFLGIIKEVKARVQTSNPRQAIQSVDTWTKKYFIKRYSQVLIINPWYNIIMHIWVVTSKSGQ